MTEVVNMEQATLLFLLAFILGIILFIVFIERAQYRIPIQYSKRMVGNVAGDVQTSYLPLRINMAGVIPPIFASSLLMFPGVLSSWASVSWLTAITDSLQPGSWSYILVFSALNIFFCYFYTAVMFNPTDVAENLKRQGGSVPGVRAGAQTSEYIDRVLTRLTFAGGLYVAAVCVVPMFVQEQFRVSFYFGGTSLLIIVSVALDTIQQIEAHLYEANYAALSSQGSESVKLRETEAI
jgi:preprotein translocase subunit SecY